MVEDEVNEVATRACLALARHQLEDALERHGHGGGAAHLGGPDGVKYLLVNQRHLHKKGIMFTTFIFSTVIADMLGLEFVWTSDCESSPRAPLGRIIPNSPSPNFPSHTRIHADHNAPPPS